MSKAASSIRRGLEQAVAFAKGTAPTRAYGTKQRGAKKGRIFDEIIDGLEELKAHREGRLTLRTHKVDPSSRVE
jgi:hypothetical protein